LAFQFCSRIQDILKYMYEACFPRKNELFSLKYIDVFNYIKVIRCELFYFQYNGRFKLERFSEAG